MQRWYLSCTTRDINVYNLNWSHHAPEASAVSLPENTSGSYSVPMDYKPSHINQCNLSCAQNIHSKNHSFQPLTPSSKCRVPGARDHQWQRLRLSRTADRDLRSTRLPNKRQNCIISLACCLVSQCNSKHLMQFIKIKYNVSCWFAFIPEQLLQIHNIDM